MFKCVEGLPSAFERIDALIFAVIFILPQVQRWIFAQIHILMDVFHVVLVESVPKAFELAS